MSDEFLASLSTCQNLSCLRLSAPIGRSLDVSDAGIGSVARCTGLQILDLLRLNRVTSAGWLQLSKLTRVTRLGLSWQGEVSLHLLQHLAHLPLEKVRD